MSGSAVYLVLKERQATMPDNETIMPWTERLLPPAERARHCAPAHLRWWMTFPSLFTPPGQSSSQWRKFGDSWQRVAPGPRTCTDTEADTAR